MKRFFMYSIILVVALFLCFSIYYFLSNNEIIKLTIAESDTIKLNVGEKVNVSTLIEHKNAHEDTTLEIKSSDTDVLTYDEKTNVLTAVSAGVSSVTITPSNTRFGPFVFNVKVGNGLSADLPFYIDSANDLRAIGETDSNWKLSNYYEIIKDIYLTGYENWTPIASNSEFTGSLDGSHHTIFDLKINNSTNSVVGGLFGTIGTNGTIKNVKISNSNILGSFDYLGVVAGRNYGTISNCEITNATIQNSKNGGLTGAVCGLNAYKNNTRAKIGMCGVETISFVTNGSTGGIVGENLGAVIENTYSVIKLANISNDYFGGIAGENTAFKNTSETVYSVIKYNHSIYSTEPNLASNFGGIVGYADDKTSNDSINSYKSNYYYSKASNAVAKQNSTNADTFNSSQFQSKTFADMKLQSTYQGFDFSEIWVMSNLYAKLKFTNTYIPEIIIDPVDPIDPDEPGDDDPVETKHFMFDVLKEMQSNPSANKTYTIMRSFDIDFSDNSAPNCWYDNFGKNWTPIGNASNLFNWTLKIANGVTATFRNLNISSYENAGFFGVIGKSGNVYGINFVNVNINLSNNDTTNYNAGVIAGTNNGTILNCKVACQDLSGVCNVGGAVGANYGTINSVQVSSNNSNNNFIITGILSKRTQNIGGIAGANYLNIVNCSVLNTEINCGASANNVGGITGLNEGVVYTSKVSNIEMEIEQSSNANSGFMVGYNDNKIKDSYAINSSLKANTSSSFVGGVSAVNSVNASILNCSLANFEIKGYTVGGIVASNYGIIQEVAVGDSDKGVGTISGVYVGGLVNTNFAKATVKNSYVLSNIVGINNSGVCSGLVNYLKSDSRVQTSYSVASLSGFGELNADTATDYRSVLGGIGQWFVNTFTGTNDNCGFIENCLLVNVNNNYIQGIMLPLDLIPNGLMYRYDITMTMDEAKGVNNYTVYTQKDFSSIIWNFDYDIAHLPTLINNPTF